MDACASADVPVENHFRETTKLVSIGSERRRLMRERVRDANKGNDTITVTKDHALINTVLAVY